LTAAGKAVFLSYASQDNEAAQHLCNALRTADIEVWFDQSELRGGDAWDALIRKQIKGCYLFVPMISANTQSREEGYFRREWKLAVDRTFDMAEDRAFLLPIVIDDTSDSEARVPEKFREVQWTRLPPGASTDAFVEHVRRLISGERLREPGGPTQAGPASAATRVSASPTSFELTPTSAWRRSKAALLVMITLVALALGYFLGNRWVVSKRGEEVSAVTAPGTAAQSVGAATTTAPSTTAPATASPAIAFNPPPHSIAVLPFLNLSGDKNQEYFSDGLTEELLNSLSAINGLQVAARTSTFSFKGKDTDIGTIARRLNVGAILEGSVRRSVHTIRITAQLINAVTGFHLWSKTYDRDNGDVLKLQTEIATSVASALEVTLLADVEARVELGGAANPAAFDAYLRGLKVERSSGDAKSLPLAIAAYTEAIRLDPRYALAFAARSMLFTDLALAAESAAAIREDYDKAQADAHQALELAPDLGVAHLALALVSDNTLNFTQANTEYERALSLAPGNAQVLLVSGTFAALMGHFDVGLAATRRALVLDPLSRDARSGVGYVLYWARRYQEVVAVTDELIALYPELRSSYAARGLSYYGLGDFEQARASCAIKPDYFISRLCLAVAYEKLGRHADAEAELAKFKAVTGDASPYQYAEIYAQWGDRAKALEWLETAWHQRDSGLEALKTDPLMDPLRQQPRFQTIQRELKFPD
jgi:TolB-like protein/cytochrome c-type biogenesis protein CcmH/NrfG